MNKKEIDKIRPECRKLIIKSQIIDLSHQLYRDIWLKMLIVIIIIQLIFGLGSALLSVICGIETVPAGTVGAICSCGCCLLVVIGNFISRKAMAKAQITKDLLYELIDSYMEDKVIVSEEDENKK